MKQKSVTLYIPTANDNLADFNKLFSLWKQIYQDNLQVTFDFSKCFFLRQNGVAFLGGLVRMIQRRGGVVDFSLDTLRPDVRKNIEKNGFLGTLGFAGPAEEGNSIPYREDPAQDKNALVHYLKSKWLGRDWIHVSDPLRDAIVGKVLEIFVNAFDHGKSPIGIFSCGQYFPHKRELNLTVVDFGVGIPSNVRIYLNDLKLDAGDCMEWAFRPGTTTKPKKGVPGGVGLALLKDFVKVTNGRLGIFSHEGCALIHKDREQFFSNEYSFEGTLVNIKLHCDSKLYYKFSTEPEQAPLF